MIQLFVIVTNSAGAAYKDGRLRPGDQILEVMKEDLRNVTHSFALHALRQTPNKVRYLGPQVILVGKIQILIGIRIQEGKNDPQK
jgi:hypothetical protein